MKNILFLLTAFLMTNICLGQDQGQHQASSPIEKAMYPPELIMKYKNEIGLTPEQEDFIKKTHMQIQMVFSEIKWDMSSIQYELEKLVSEEKPDVEAAKQKLKELLIKENEIKLLQLELMLKIKNNLNAEQKKKLDQYHSKD